MNKRVGWKKRGGGINSYKFLYSSGTRAGGKIAPCTFYASSSNSFSVPMLDWPTHQRFIHAHMQWHDYCTIYHCMKILKGTLFTVKHDWGDIVNISGILLKPKVLHDRRWVSKAFYYYLFIMWIYWSLVNTNCIPN